MPAQIAPSSYSRETPAHKPTSLASLPVRRFSVLDVHSVDDACRLAGSVLAGLVRDSLQRGRTTLLLGAFVS